jgi:hypothetical protein
MYKESIYTVYCCRDDHDLTTNELHTRAAEKDELGRGGWAPETDSSPVTGVASTHTARRCSTARAPRPTPFDADVSPLRTRARGRSCSPAGMGLRSMGFLVDQTGAVLPITCACVRMATREHGPPHPRIQPPP